METGRRTVRAASGMLNSVLTAAMAGGTLIGMMAVSTWFSWTLTWGDDWPFSMSAMLMVCLGFVVADRMPVARLFRWVELAIAGCAWTLLLPWLNPCLAGAIQFIPVESLSSSLNRFALGSALSLPTWFVMGVLWQYIAVAIQKSESTSESNGDFRASAAGIAFGVGMGLATSTFAVAPWIGPWNTVALAIIALIVFRVVRAKWVPGQPVAGNGVDVQSTVNMAGRPFAIAEVIQVVAILAMGGLLAVEMRLAGSLFPAACQYLAAEWIGLLVGFGAGVWLLDSRKPSTLIPWTAAAIPAAAGVCLIAFLPRLILLALWMTTSVTAVWLLMSFRVLLLGGVMAPLGFGIAGLIRLTSDAGAEINSTGNRRRSLVGWIPMVFAIGFVLVTSCFGAIELIRLLTGCTYVLAAVGIWSARNRLGRMSSRAGWVCLTACTLMTISAPLWGSHDDPAQVAKLLFSTPAFMAHRAGLESSLLTAMDDSRVLEQRRGVHGQWTLWRSRGMELLLRENSIPRAVISTNTDAIPQPAPAVLQAVFPLVIARQPYRVMILGAGGGVPLETCLQFPVQHVTCVEEDATLIDILRGPVARETGLDPFRDDRTELVNVPPGLGLMAGSDVYDVILSSPQSSAITAGGASYTVDFYRQAARRLAERGIFSQRLECIDYGPTPLRLVIQSMRQAFVEVVAIETGAGEVLLLATNSPDVFVPENLASRLELTHVRRVIQQCGMDWSTLLNLPAYDHPALGEICSEARTPSNTPADGMLALRAPLELMRWGRKLSEVQQVLTANRTTESPHLNKDKAIDPERDIVNLSRKSRILEWLGDEHVAPELLRRLSEVVTQQKLVQEFPESHWWEYRKALRQQMQDRPHPAVKMVSHTDEESRVHPDDERRKRYFVALGSAARSPAPSEEQIDAIEACLEPVDPLLSYFARQEIADLMARSGANSVSELLHRLHVINFAPGSDASTRNVATAIKLVVNSPETVPDGAQRFDLLNGLVQSLITRWSIRQSTYSPRSPRMQLTDVNRSVVAIEAALAEMEKLSAKANLSATDWTHRRQVIERSLLRPLRELRTNLQSNMTQREIRNQSLMQDAAPPVEPMGNR